MEIIRVIYNGFNAKSKQFANCIMMVQRPIFSVAKIYEISVAEKYPICSAIFTDRLIKEECKKVGGDFWKAYLKALENQYSLTIFKQKPIPAHAKLRIPRFSESDFTAIFEDLGGEKIPESKIETPDFYLNGIIMELKDIQHDSLHNEDRQKNLARIFADFPDRSINLDPEIERGEITAAYHSLIDNSLRNNVKNASSQIKSYRNSRQALAAGMIFLNTGMFSLPHELFKTLVGDILIKRTRTIEFVFIFSQVMQTNGFDTYAVFPCEFVGNVPEQIDILLPCVKKMIQEKMNSMVTNPTHGLALASQEPISFEKNNKIFYWNPGILPDSRNPSN